jgi:tetratricopeptide (TPR) repeat protein
VRARLLVRIGQSYASLGEYGAGRPLLEQALEIRRGLFGEDSLEVADSLYSLGNCLRLEGDRESLPMLERALAIRRARGGEPDEKLARYQVAVATGLCLARRFDEAIGLLSEAGATAERLPGDRRRLRELILSNLASALQQVRRHEEAIPVARRAVELSREIHGGPHPGLVSSLNTLALSLKGVRSHEEAREIYDDLLAAAETLHGRESDRYAIFAMNKASLLDDVGAFDEAERLYDEAWAVLQRVVGPDNPHRVACRGNMAGLYVRTKRWELARDAYLDCVPRLLAIDGPGSTRAALSQCNLGLCHEALGDLPRAVHALREALGIAERSTDPSRGYRVARAKAHLARALARSGTLEEVCGLLDEVEAFVAAAPRDNLSQHAAFARALQELASGERDSARARLADLGTRPQLDDDAAWVPAAARARSAALRIEAEPSAALAALEAEIPALEALLGPSHPETRAASEALARVAAR